MFRVRTVKTEKVKDNKINFISHNPHESSEKHVSGSAQYVDDIPLPAGSLHAYIGFSECAHGLITSLDLSDVRELRGVIDVFTANSIPGNNDISPTGKNDEPILAENEVLFWGQPIFVVVAKTRNIARKAARLAKVTYDDLDFISDIRTAEANGGVLVAPSLELKNGNVENALKEAPRRIKGEIEIGGQDHFYLEGQVALTLPGEDNDITVFSSTQHPSEVQHMVSQALGLSSHSVKVEVRRMGGGFGGKETQSNQFAVLSALAAVRNNCAVKLRLDRDDDMICTGKRHDFIGRYDIGFDQTGKIWGVDVQLSARCGFSSDLSGPVTDRALFHIDNCYFFPNARLRSFPLKTNTVSNTAFRGFGGPQGMMVGERIIQEIAFDLQKDPLEIRKVNLYGKKNMAVTPYHQTVTDNIAPRIISELEEKGKYKERREKIIAFNKTNKFFKKGIALTPVKFGISFTATWYNQAGSLIHIYTDGSIYLNHGGTEMGQGLHTKMASIVAAEFDLPVSNIKVSATDTSKVPNTSATAASSGSDLNGMAVLNAVNTLKMRLSGIICDLYHTDKKTIYYKNGYAVFDCGKIKFENLVKMAYEKRVQLSAAGFYKTPKIHWNRDKGSGRPFYYFSYGAALAEVTVDEFTGESSVDRVDILHDVGESLNEHIDLGQIEGGFIQGMGWLTNEELWWNKEGQLKTHAPSTYKIPLASDRPRIFNIELANWSKNKERTIKRSKAVGEPPFMLAISVHEALLMAASYSYTCKVRPTLNSPATAEKVLECMRNSRIKSLE
ncbi:MAG: xanthine dehydrogenase molybdopterin binding subunit [Paracoccaceae bacterium]|nr:xanthine dehydrogenase molybdopterin binding subunit [Paracoccaceae bacterium]